MRDVARARPPPAPEVTGGSLIAAGYASPEQARNCQGMQVTATRFVVDGSTVAAELVFSTSTSTREVIDVFDVDADGKIRAMTAYSR